MPELLLHLDYRKGTGNEPMSICTKLGWVLFGGGSRSNSISSNFLQQPRVVTPKCWAVLVHRVLRHKKTPRHSHHVKSRETFNAHSTRNHDKEERNGMLWSRDEISLRNNRNLAVKRLLSIERNLEKKSWIIECITMLSMIISSRGMLNNWHLKKFRIRHLEQSTYLIIA